MSWRQSWISSAMILIPMGIWIVSAHAKKASHRSKAIFSEGTSPATGEYLQEVVEEEGEFAQEAADLLDLMDRYEKPGRLSVQEKQSILDQIAEITGSGKVPEKGKRVPAKEEAR